MVISCHIIRVVVCEWLQGTNMLVQGFVFFGGGGGGDFFKPKQEVSKH